MIYSKYLLTMLQIFNLGILFEGHSEVVFQTPIPSKNGSIP